MRKYLAVIALALGFAVPAHADPTDTVTWTFNLPATGLGSQNPPYPSVATLTLLETINGVQFTLTPAWNDPPPGRFGDNAMIERIDFVIDFAAGLTAANFVWNSGAPVKSFTFDTNANMDAGYKADDQHVIVDFYSKNNDPDAFRFDSTFSNSVWTILGVTIDDFTGTSATADNKPSPIQGIISVTSYSLEDLHPTPSNWVSPSLTPGQQCAPGVACQVPEPGTLPLLAVALLGLGYAVRRRVSPKVS